MGDRDVSVSGVPLRARPLLVVLFAVLVLAAGREAAAQGRLVRVSGTPSTGSAAVAQGQSAGRRELRIQPVTVDLSVLPAGPVGGVPALLRGGLEVELFDGRVVAVALDRIDGGRYGTIYSGIVPAAASSQFTAARVGAAFVAALSIDGEEYEIRYEGAALRLQQIDPAAAFTCGVVDPPAAAGAAAPARIVDAASEPDVIEVLLAFTTAAQAGAGGTSGAQALADLTIAQINQALARSQVSQRFSLKGVMSTAATEGDDYSVGLSRVQSPSDGFMDDVAITRDSLQADLVALIVEADDPGGSAGRGYLLLSQSKFNSPWGYSIDQRRYLGARLLGHEMGHNLGLSHDRANTSPGSSFLPYAYGYQLPNVFYTIMAYPCLFCRGIDYYSNPAVFVDGQPTGIADFADEARALRENFPTVAGFRGCPSSVTDFEEAPAEGGPFRFTIHTPAGCPWNVSLSSVDMWVTPPRPATGLGSATIWLLAAPLPAISGGRSTFVFVDGQSFRIDQRPRVDTDGDGLPDAWERRFGLDPGSTAGTNGASGDGDGDGVTNAQEFANGTHPFGRYTRYLAEGSSNAFFETRLALFNPGDQTGTVLVRFRQPGRAAVNTAYVLAGHQRLTVTPRTIAGVDTDFATIIESSEPIVIDRTMSWDGSGYGSHAETSLPSPSTTWYLAEGSTSGDFSLFYLLQNPGAVPVSVTIRYLLPLGLPPLERTYSLAPDSRLTIPVDDVAPELASTDVSAVVTSAQPIIVERAMYLNVPGQPFAAGHESAGVTAPATRWFLAEGATGPFFDLFVLLSNPSTSRAEVDVDYLLSTGATFRKHYSLAPESRSTIWVDDEQVPAGSGTKPFANVAVSTTVTSTNAVPVIVERTMWWPGPEIATPFWTEAHNSAGSTASGTAWALAEGEVGGLQNAETFVLIANTSPTAGSARVTLYFEDGVPVERTVTLLPNSRTTVNVSADFPAAINRRFGTRVESLGATPAQIVVERAMYTSPGGVTWAAGTNALGTKLN